MRKHASQVKRMKRKRVSHLVPARPTPDTNAAETLTSLFDAQASASAKQRSTSCLWLESAGRGQNLALAKRSMSVRSSDLPHNRTQCRVTEPIGR